MIEEYVAIVSTVPLQVTVNMSDESPSDGLNNWHYCEMQNVIFWKSLVYVKI